MSIKQLQRDIRNAEGYILSDGTLNLQHLLPKAYDLIVGYNMKSKTAKDIKKGIKEVFINNADDDGICLNPIFEAQYYSLIELDENDDEKMETASRLWDEDIYDYFNNIAPNNYYFGSSEDDGACIGWFKYDENKDY
jgi:hypothetical protein